METKMFRARIEVKQNDEVKFEYNFSDFTKEGLYASATNYFCGFIQAVADITSIYLIAPCVKSFDGFQAWSKGRSFTVKLLNEKGDIIAKVDDII